MKRLTIFSDLHIGAPHEMSVNLGEYINDKDVFLTGDIYDLKNTPKKKIKEYEKRFRNTKEMFGERYIIGNHECIKPKTYHHISYGVLFLHGHTIYWDYEKVKRWENKKHGLNKFRYLFYRLKHIGSYEGKKKEPSAKIKEKCFRLCSIHKCHTIVFGHTHKSCDIMYKGIRIINVPRGKTTLIVEEK